MSDFEYVTIRESDIVSASNATSDGFDFEKCSFDFIREFEYWIEWQTRVIGYGETPYLVTLDLVRKMLLKKQIEALAMPKSIFNPKAELSYTPIKYEVEEFRFKVRSDWGV